MDKRDEEKLKNIDFLIGQTEDNITYIKEQISYYYSWYKINKKQIEELENKKQEIKEKEE